MDENWRQCCNAAMLRVYRHEVNDSIELIGCIRLFENYTIFSMLILNSNELFILIKHLVLNIQTILNLVNTLFLPYTLSK